MSRCYNRFTTDSLSVYAWFEFIKTFNCLLNNKKYCLSNETVTVGDLRNIVVTYCGMIKLCWLCLNPIIKIIISHKKNENWLISFPQSNSTIVLDMVYNMWRLVYQCVCSGPSLVQFYSNSHFVIQVIKTVYILSPLNKNYTTTFSPNKYIWLKEKKLKRNKSNIYHTHY